MTTNNISTEIRPGAYYDSVILMQLQRALAALPDVQEAGVVMGTAANLDVLDQSGLRTTDLDDVGAEDLVIVVQGTDDAAADAAIEQVDSLLQRRRESTSSDISGSYRPKSIESAAQMLPAAQWVLISSPGRYAADIARDALRAGKNVFLYSDNVSIEDEVDLKRRASEQGLLVMGPDCGTAIINGVGLGFANRVRRGSIGIVGASGTGLQQVTACIHRLGAGITHALGTGGRDLSEAVGAVSARQALDMLARDPETVVIVIISKPPTPRVAEELLQVARATGKPVVVNFIGYRADGELSNSLHFVRTLDQAAACAVELVDNGQWTVDSGQGREENKEAYLRGLFSGGTLAYEAQLILQEYGIVVNSNAPLDQRFQLENSLQSQGHTILDLGEDEFTVGRLHPMMDNTLRLQRLEQEAADPEVAILLFDIVLGDGSHPDPASEFVPVIEQASADALQSGRVLEFMAVVVGTDEDPQDLAAQVAQLEAAGTQVILEHEVAIRRIGVRLQQLNRPTASPPVDLAVLHEPLAAINVGLESFTDSLVQQGAEVVQVDWKPPARGNAKLMGILARMSHLD